MHAEAGLPATVRRIWVIGPSGAGKSTLARQLADVLGLPHHELDAMFWGPGWQRRPEEEFRAAVAGLDSHPGWVVDGQYHLAHPVLEALADAVVWVDPARGTTMVRLIRRTVYRLVSRAELWNGNRERPGSALQLLGWAHREFPRVRRTNEALAGRLARRSVPCVRVRTTSDIRALLAAAERGRDWRVH